MSCFLVQGVPSPVSLCGWKETAALWYLVYLFEDQISYIPGWLQILHVIEDDLEHLTFLPLSP